MTPPYDFELPILADPKLPGFYPQIVYRDPTDWPQQAPGLEAFLDTEETEHCVRFLESIGKKCAPPVDPNTAIAATLDFYRGVFAEVGGLIVHSVRAIPENAKSNEPVYATLLGLPGQPATPEQKEKLAKYLGLRVEDIIKVAKVV